MVFKGTKTRSAEMIASQVDSIGGHMDAFTAKEYAAFHLKVLDQHLPTAVEILGDIVLNPLFDAREMTKEKKVIFEEMGMVEDTPDDLVVEMFTQAFWPGHPLGRPILGTRQSVGRFTRDQLSRFFRDTYRTSNLLVAAAGNLDHRTLRRLIERHFGGLARSTASANGGPPRPSRRLVTRSKKELEQVHLCLGAPCYPQAHADRYVSYILNTVLGGSMSSRLFQNIREKRGLAYSISSGAAAYADAGVLSIYAGTGLEVVNKVVQLTVEEIKRLKDEPVPAEELRRAKDQLKGSLVLSLESSGSRMSHLARQEIYFGRQFSLDQIMAGVEQVEADDIQRVANELFRDRLAMSLLGNLKGYRPTPALLRV
jgi:predicted Zn-dependent peptidase